MKTGGKIIKQTRFAFLLAGLSASAAHDWSRYEIIMERSPFGKEPPPSETAETAKPSGEFAKQYRLCMLCGNAQGQLKAGIVSKVNNKNFYLQVGESEGGLSLVGIRLEEGIAIFQQGDETAQLLLEGLGGDPAAASAQRGIAAATAALMPGNTLVQQIRQTGAVSAPEHILAELTDSAPKQAQITVRDTNSDPLTDSVDTVGNSPNPAPEAPPAMAAQAPAPANYLVQSVPKRFVPVMN